jgi:hypothetical protein
VRGRSGPRPRPENRYPRKDSCECVDQRGNPSPLKGGDGDCVKCGHVVRR